MNSKLENQDNRMGDMFHSIREVRSPLSMNAVKNYILEHIEEMTLWQKLQRLILQTGAFSIIIASICCINSPAGETKGEINIRIADHTQNTPFSNDFARSIKGTNTHTITLEKAETAASFINRNTMSDSVQTDALSSSNENIAPIQLTPTPKVDLSFSFINSKLSELSDLLVEKESETSPIRPFAEVQGIAYSGHIRMYGEGFATGVMHDWQILSLHVMNANGTHDNSKDASSLTNIGIKKETGQQIALMFGGIIEKGRVYSSIQIGPSYNMSQITSGIKDVPASNTILSQKFFGISGQISAGYRITDFLSANIEGLLNYHSGISGGLMLSVMIQR